MLRAGNSWLIVKKMSEKNGKFSWETFGSREENIISTDEETISF